MDLLLPDSDVIPQAPIYGANSKNAAAYGDSHALESLNATDFGRFCVAPRPVFAALFAFPRSQIEAG
jgi:hypothetical protein